MSQNSIKFIFLFIFILLSKEALALSWPSDLGPGWVRDQGLEISDHLQFSYKEGPQIILKTSQVATNMDFIKNLSDQSVVEHATSGKKFADKIYEYQDIKNISETITRSSEGVEIFRKESYKDDRDESFYRINRIIIKNNNFYNAELIWPAVQNELVNNVVLKKFEELNVL